MIPVRTLAVSFCIVQQCICFSIIDRPTIRTTRIDTKNALQHALLLPLNLSRSNDHESPNAIRSKLINNKIVNEIITNNNGALSGSDGNNGNNGGDSGAIEMMFVGKGSIELGIGASSNEKSTRTTIPSDCLFLSPSSSSSSSSSSTITSDTSIPLPCIPIPLPTSSSKPLLKLLSFAYQAKPISKSLCLALAPILINRDGSLYDNLPWNTWTIENVNNKRNVDAAGNNVDEKYHLGKRDAYNRFMGKDWYGRSVSIGNLAARAKYLLESDNDSSGSEENSSNTDRSKQQSDQDKEEIISLDENAAKILTKRVLELEIKESKMAIAEAQEQLAIIQTELAGGGATNNIDFDSLSDEILIENYDRLQNAIQAVQDAKESLDENETALKKLLSTNNNDNDGSDDDGQQQQQQQQQQTAFLSILNKIIDSQQSDAPYRGAIGYKPTIDTQEEMLQKSILPYSSPYELMNEIINEQLNAEVIGCFIENTSLFNGSTVLGGALVLKRKSVKKEVVIDGERVVMNDSDDDLGNKGITGGEVIVVECDCDEAIGMAVTCGESIFISSDIWSTSQISCVVVSNNSSNDDGDGGVDGVKNEKMGIIDVIPNIQIVEAESVVMRTQGDGIMSKGTSIQVPRDYNDRSIGNLFPTDNDRAVFSTDIPVTNLQEYDEMTVADKAQMLLSLQSFQGRLPRPRVLKEAMTTGTTSTNEKYKKKSSNDTSLYSSTFTPLDEMLIPLIDESVRRQIMVREAKRRGDTTEAEMLNEDKSMRQRAKENAEEARSIGNEDLAKLWEEEAELYASLRADVTQDEGMYSSFLDRDEWYERDRRKVVERNKKRFGSLFNNDEK